VDLAEEEEEEEGGEEGRKGGQERQRKDREVLFELQALFALLQTSEKKAADTLPFCQVRGRGRGREGGRVGEMLRRPLTFGLPLLPPSVPD